MGFLRQKTIVVSRIFGFPLSPSFLAHLHIVKLYDAKLDETRSPRQKQQQIESFFCVAPCSCNRHLQAVATFWAAELRLAAVQRRSVTPLGV
jgi:hypothetical protein